LSTAKEISNPLALVMLVLLFERPMHPYEMVTTLRARHQQESIKLRLGSLYTVIQMLLRDRLIAAKETVRDGPRPERTVYALTAAGRTLMRKWMREILSEPVKEYPRFEAGLTLLAALPPEEVVELLGARAERLGGQMKELRGCLDQVLASGVPPLFLVEAEYRIAQLKSEREFVNKVLRRIVEEDWASVKQWKEAHARREPRR
jgi:DNA-binding PadR family transcriptional regulator